MTVNTTTSSITYIGDGATVTFSFPFAVPAAVDVQASVTVGGVTTTPTVTVTVNPAVAPNPTPVGGSVTFAVAPVNGSSVMISRVLPQVQATSLANQSVLYPTVIEQSLDYLTMMKQQGTTEISHAFTAPSTDPIPLPTPSVAARANKDAIFDASGNLTAGTTIGNVTVSAPMIPVVTAASIPLAQQALGLAQVSFAAISGVKNNVTGTYTVVNGDKGKTINATSGFYVISLNAANTYDADFQVYIYNNDSRGKAIAPSGVTPYVLYPNQATLLIAAGSTWLWSNPGFWAPTSTANFFVDPVNGNDSNDGLATGTGAFLTIQQAVNVVATRLAGPGVINLANGSYSVSNVVISAPPVGAASYNIQGNVSTPNNVIINVASGATGFIIQDNASATIHGMLIKAASGSVVAISARWSGFADVSLCNFGDVGTSGSHLFALDDGVIRVSGTYHIATGANFQAHWFAVSGGVIRVDTVTCIIDGPVTTSGAFLLDESAFVWGAPTTVFTNPGNVTGQQYIVSINGTATLAGATPPGTVAGTVSTGGIFV